MKNEKLSKRDISALNRALEVLEGIVNDLDEAGHFDSTPYNDSLNAMCYLYTFMSCDIDDDGKIIEQ